MEQESPSPTWVVHEIVRKAATAPVLVVGGGLTGFAVAKLLKEGGVAVAIADEGTVTPARRSELGEIRYFEQLSLQSEEQQSIVKDLFYKENFAFAIVSPGVNPRSNLIKTVQAAGVTLLSELDFAFSFLGFPEICVTGTNGKSTVVKLIADMLNASGIAAEAVGNIGVPLSARVNSEQLRKVISGAEAEFIKRPHFIAELSSYQIEWLQLNWSKRSGGQISVYLNASDDHLERHGSMQGYVAAKARLFALQGDNDWAIVNKDDPHAKEVTRVVQGNYLPFGRAKFSPKLANSCYIDDDSKRIILTINGEEQSFDSKQWQLPGYHNRENLAACIAAASLAGATQEGIIAAYSSFRLLPHRIEKVGEVGGVTFINDSKGTNVSAVVVALESVRSDLGKDQQIVLLLGGFLKEGNWDCVKAALSGVRAIVFIGRDGPKIKEILALGNGFLQLERRSMQEALEAARSIAVPGDAVLLSPGCSSFDSYNNFEERGEDFRQIVLGMK